MTKRITIAEGLTMEWSTSPERPQAIAERNAYTVRPDDGAWQWIVDVWSLDEFDGVLALDQCLLTVDRFETQDKAKEFCEAFEQTPGATHRRRDLALDGLGYEVSSQVVRIVRDGLGLTGEELAARLGVAARTVRKWEGGQLEVSPGVRSDLAALEKVAAHHVVHGIPDDESEDWPDGWRRAIAFRQRQQA